MKVKNTALKSRGKLMALNKQPQRRTRWLEHSVTELCLSAQVKKGAKFRIRGGTEFTGLQRNRTRMEIVCKIVTSQ